jgi:hypothetical protein
VTFGYLKNYSNLGKVVFRFCYLYIFHLGMGRNYFDSKCPVTRMNLRVEFFTGTFNAFDASLAISGLVRICLS